MKVALEEELEEMREELLLVRSQLQVFDSLVEDKRASIYIQYIENSAVCTTCIYTVLYFEIIYFKMFY